MLNYLYNIYIVIIQCIILFTKKCVFFMIYSKPVQCGKNTESILKYYII